MKSLLNKDIRLWASPLAWIFLIAAGMTMLPGYPILVGSFFVCFGVFQSFQSGRENNDILYSVLLPIRKVDVVRSKYRFTVMIQIIGFFVMAALTTLRMTCMADSAVYQANALMNATPYYLGFVLLIFTSFNVFFVGSFFKTAYKIGIPFLVYGIATFLIIAVGEILHHLPGLSYLHTQGGEKTGTQLCFLVICAMIYSFGTLLSCRSSMRKFEQIDL